MATLRAIRLAEADQALAVRGERARSSEVGERDLRARRVGRWRRVRLVSLETDVERAVRDAFPVLRTLVCRRASLRAHERRIQSPALPGLALGGLCASLAEIRERRVVAAPIPGARVGRWWCVAVVWACVRPTVPATARLSGPAGAEALAGLRTGDRRVFASAVGAVAGVDRRALLTFAIPVGAVVFVVAGRGVARRGCGRAGGVRAWRRAGDGARLVPARRSCGGASRG